MSPHHFSEPEFSWPCAQVATVQSADVHTHVRHDDASEVAVYRDLPCTERCACVLSVTPESSTVYFRTSSGRAMCQSIDASFPGCPCIDTQTDCPVGVKFRVSCYVKRGLRSVTAGK